VNKAALEALVASGACDRFGPRRDLLWKVGVVPRPQSVGSGHRQLALPLEPTAAVPELPAQTPWEEMLADYGTTGISIGPHPLELLRPHLPAATLASHELAEHPQTFVAVAGMAVARQRPATANGVVFMLLEDEFGQINLIVPPPVYERYRPLVRGEPLLLARGKLERSGRGNRLEDRMNPVPKAVAVVVQTLETLGPLAREIAGLAEVQAALPRAHHFGHR
jgi:error-prone DNA polymerase